MPGFFVMQLISWSHDCRGEHLTLRGWHTPPSGKPLLHFLHGNGFCGRTYEPMLEHLATHFDLWLCDAQGHGDSDCGKRFLGWDRNAELALQAWIARHLGPPLPTRAAAALAFGWTERTLARRLQRQGTTWGALLDDARRAQALQRVGGTTQPLKDIALGLGFAELSPFYRAFARWTGATPGQWRAQGQAGEREA